ncbi:GspE/PulE family protein [Halanaerobium praevalens]|uniref:Type II secretion system protein E n=1 Tax=Halanaerobium praevalens (strain ATCC 33744 / DSM 2228 / GSL) TaxID=572479 RepID=E3DRI1_HALPG|nr:GspE/PulE family protein [Halanaerobium praevalens]ADO77022.1 type II secretion system protein E [Halanaerobium praevalens DSM 2228]
MQSFYDFLINQYQIPTKAQVKLFNLTQNENLKSLIDFIKTKNIISEKNLLTAMANYFDFKLYKDFKIKNNKIELPLLELEQVEKYKIIIINKTKSLISFGTLYPPDLFLEEKLKFKFKVQVKFYLMSKKEFYQLKDSIYSSYFKVDQQELLKEFSDFKKIDSRDIDSLKNIVEDAPIVKLLNKILTEAIAVKASDIHLEKKENYFKIRYRVDGILKTYYKLPVKISAAVISRIKIISAMDITIRHLPQDGKMEFKFQGAIYDIRTSVIPTIYGEKAVLRLLLRNENLLQVKELNFSKHNLKRFKQILKFNSGIILVSGPTGSGKTTTLFSILNELATEKNNIITVENPVEYKLDLLNQIEINKAQGLKFPIILRSILRQDPDIIMIGEIRDQETAQIAVRAAVTGHLVLSTIHTVDSISAVIRLIDMGIPPYLISSTLNAVIAQRLLLKLCSNCKEKIRLQPKYKTIFKEKDINYSYQPVGCKKCNDGHLGRIPTAEILIINNQIRNIINQNSNYSKLKQAAVASGMMTLAQSSLEKLKNGIVAKDELLRVINFSA